MMADVSLLLLLKSLSSIKREAHCDAEGWSNAGLEGQHNLPRVQGLQVNGNAFLTFDHDPGVQYYVCSDEYIIILLYIHYCNFLFPADHLPSCT